MTDAELDALEAAARAATPGPWYCYEGDLIFPGKISPIQECQNNSYIAAANPTVILELIAELRQARKERNWIIEQIFTGWPCPPPSDETQEDCDKKISCEDCWLQAAKEAVNND